jgi:hypothetical protein
LLLFGESPFENEADNLADDDEGEEGENDRDHDGAFDGACLKGVTLTPYHKHYPQYAYHCFHDGL